jgi:hypothetical protein
MTEFAYIENWDMNVAPLKHRDKLIQFEIAYQLKRIADILDSGVTVKK